MIVTANTNTTVGNQVAISGNTYPVKDKLLAMGGRWDAARKSWMVPSTRAADARRIVSAAPKSAHGGYRATRKCAECGALSHGYQYCWDCRDAGW